MSFFARNLIHTIAFRTTTAARDANGDAVAKTATQTARARVESRRDKVRGPDGNEVVTAHRIYTDTVIPPGAVVWVPFLGDDVTNDNHGRRPIAVTSSEQLRGGSTLCTVYL